jgi:glutamate-1-semialdehyde aminotransferase
MNDSDLSAQGIMDFQESLATIPGGTQLFSKRPELFSPTKWPTYFARAKGITIWDKQGNKFLDMSQMGVGSCILGYSYKQVNKAVVKSINLGVQSTLISNQELELAAELLDIHKWANMVRYARSGGEAMSIAVRIARVASGKEKVLFSGYHGWNDWYLAANLEDEDHLSKVLLPGLSAKGVPTGLAGTSIPFEFNNREMFDGIMQIHSGDIAAIVMEPRRSEPATPGFLEHIRKVCDKNGIVLIFDEITTGWRGGIGGIHLQGNVMPDVAVFAKAMANGFAMSAIIGISSVMGAANSSFISSTNWTERVGPAAALATIREYKSNNVSEYISRIGKFVQEGWTECGKSNNIDLSINTKGLPALASFSFNYPFGRALNIEFTEKMLEKGWLAHNQFKPSFSHTDRHVKNYLDDLDKTFSHLRNRISNFEDELISKSEMYPAPAIPRLTR